MRVSVRYGHGAPEPEAVVVELDRGGSVPRITRWLEGNDVRMIERRADVRRVRDVIAAGGTAAVRPTHWERKEYREKAGLRYVRGVDQIWAYVAQDD